MHPRRHQPAGVRVFEMDTCRFEVDSLVPYGTRAE